jgi:predicted nucleotidyltransferase
MAVDVQTSRASLLAREREVYLAREQQRQTVHGAVCQAARSILPRYRQVRRAYLFGSLTRPGGLNETSDLDVAVEGLLSAYDFFALWAELERAIHGWSLDLVELDRRGLHFAQRVRETGELIYERTDSDTQSRHSG